MFLYLFIHSPSVDTKLPLSHCRVIKALTLLPPVGSPPRQASPISSVALSLCDTELVKNTFCLGQGSSRAGAPLWLTGLVLSTPVALGKHGLFGLEAAATVVQGIIIQVLGVKCPACLQRERAASKGQGQHVPLGKGSRFQPPQARDGSGDRPQAWLLWTP